MGKKTKKVPVQAQKIENTKTSRKSIPDRILTVSKPRSYFDLKPVFSFLNTDPNRWKISEWKGKELLDLIKCFQKMESRTWNELITSSGGLQMKKLKDPPKPQYVSEDVEVYEVRVCKVKRIHGFITDNIFNILWFDRKHTFNPTGPLTREQAAVIAVNLYEKITGKKVVK